MCSLRELIVAAVMLAYQAQGNRGGLHEYCFPNSFNASCGPSDVIMMKSARYGRIKEGQCISSALHVGCWANVLDHVDRMCSGRHNCTINIPDTTLHNLQPCPKDMFAYLESEYECLSVSRDPTWSCHPKTTLEVPAPSGYLASITTVETGLGSRSCPWTIRVAPGQRINVTLFDFGVVSRSQHSGSMCQVYAKIREQGMASEITVCGGQERQRGVYVSETNEIEAMMLTSHDEANPVYFALRYDVVGCTDPLVPQGAWLKRTGEKAMIGCNHTTQVWHIVCHGNEWFGKMENCSKLDNNPQSGGFASTKGDFPYGLMVAVITGLVLGVLIGVALLAMVIVCHRRKRQRGSHPPVDSQEAVMETVQGTPFLREKQGHKPEAVDSGYGYTHVCDVTIYQPYQQRQMSTFRGGAADVTKPAIEGDHTPQRQGVVGGGVGPRDYEKTTGYIKPCTPVLGREPRYYTDYDIDHGVNAGSPAHKILYTADSKSNSGGCEH